MPPQEPVKIDWKKVVEESKGRSFFVPEKHKELVEKWETLRKELGALTDLASEKEVKTQVALQNMFLALREHAVESGIDDAWTSDIGFDTDALKEGVHVVNLVSTLK